MNNNGQKASVPMDELLHEQLDEANKHIYYKRLEEELTSESKADFLKISKEDSENQDIEKYKETFRNFYYTSEILSNNKSNEFFEEAVRDVHPTVKVKGPSKNILKSVCKVFVQQLAQNCLQILQQSEFRGTEIDVETVIDAARLLSYRQPKNNNVSKLFTKMY